MRPTGGDCEGPDPPRNAQPDSADSSRAPDHYNSSAMMRGLAIAFTALMLCALSSACANQNPLISESSGAQNRVRQQADVHAALALAYLNQRQTEAARAEARRALALAPGHRDALHTLALTALAQGDAGAARRHFEQAFNAEGGADDVTFGSITPAFYASITRYPLDALYWNMRRAHRLNMRSAFSLCLTYVKLRAFFSIFPNSDLNDVRKRFFRSARQHRRAGHAHARKRSA